MTSAVVILSGGLDSTVALHLARARHGRIHALFIDWRQKSVEVERAASRRIADMAGATWTEVSCPVFDELGTMLTQRSAEPVTQAVNFFTRGPTFLATASRHVEITRADALVVGYTAEDNLPESSLESVAAMDVVLGLVLQRPFKIEAPLAEMTKAEIVALARTLPGCWDALRCSVSCFAGTRCGECKACLLRARGFAAAGLADPAGAA